MKRLLCLISIHVLQASLMFGEAKDIAQDVLDDAVIERKINESQEMVEKGIKYFKKYGIESSAKVFAEDPTWRMGEQYIFIFGEDGICYSFGDQLNTVWKKLTDKQLGFEADFLPALLEKARSGGTMNFSLNNAFMQAFVKSVEKDGSKYVLGACFAPQSDRNKCMQLVKDAAWYLTRTGNIKNLATEINNPQGQFIYGDISVLLLDFEGYCIANGESYAFVGQNLMGLKTPDGALRTQDQIKIAREKGSGWYEYAETQGSARKNAYVKKVVDPTTKKEYVLVSGYFPGVTDDAIRSFLKKTVSYLRENGSIAAFRDFSSKTGDFASSGMTVFVYSINGDMLASSANPEFVGSNLQEAQDGDGKFYVREILNVAEQYGKGWISYSAKNAYRATYVEKVKAPDGDFIVGVGYFPNTQQSRARFMTDRAEFYLQNHTKADSLSMFMGTGSDFLQGDMHVTVYNTQGICLVDGLHTQHIWQDDKKKKDAKGEYFVKRLLSTATSGGGWVDYMEYGATKRVYVRGVEKDIAEGKGSETLAVMCGYYN